MEGIGKSLSLVLISFIMTSSLCQAQPEFEISRNVYRLPYANGKEFTVSSDVYTHNPQGRYDLKASGVNNCSTHVIVAAAAGRVMRVVENNDESCPDCGASNNYVWIQHANDEWTKYTHMAYGSVPVAVGDTVCAGATLGYECWVGATTPANSRHLHFEVRRPVNPQNVIIDPAGGYMDSLDGFHLIPVMTTPSKHYMADGDILTASSSTSCTAADITPGATTIGNAQTRIYMASATVSTSANTITYNDGSNGLYQAGTSVTLEPGFHARAGTFFTARIGNCATTPFPGGCN